MRKDKLRCLVLSLFVVAASLVGCGGGGGGGSSPNTSLGVFITDDLNTNYDHVWVTIKQIALSGSTGTKVVFDDAAGRVVDLKTLRDSSGERFLFLGMARIESGQYTTVSVTLDKDLKLFPAGTSVAQNRVFAGFDGGTGNKVLTAAISVDVVSGSDRFVLDFDLSQWTDSGTEVTAVIDLGSETHLGDIRRHEMDEHEGTVSNLSGEIPNLTFTLTWNNSAFQVRTDAQTSIYNSDGSPNPTLAEGKRVEVRGSYDIAQDVFVATSLKIEDASETGEHEVQGAPLSIDDVAGTLVVTLRRVKGFLPSVDTVNIATDGGTEFFGHSGLSLTKEAFFLALASATEVEVEGTYNSGTNTLTAFKAKVEDDQAEDNAEIKGSASSVNAVNFTFSITAIEVEGANIAPGSLVPVVTDASAEFRNQGGETVTRAQFFTELINGHVLEVRGSYDGTTLTAFTVKYED